MSKLIVLEGLDGAGKTTQLRLLAQHLRQKGHAVFTDAEPTAGETGKLLRRMLSGELFCTPWAAAALFTADRIRHNTDPENGILRHLADGEVVLLDRYYYSTFAYQGMDTDLDWLIAMHRGCPEIRRPDLVLYLTMAPEKCMERIRQNRSAAALEIFETAEKLTEVDRRFRAAFAAIAHEENVVTVDADGTVEAVAARIAAAADRLFEKETAK